MNDKDTDYIVKAWSDNDGVGRDGDGVELFYTYKERYTSIGKNFNGKKYRRRVCVCVYVHIGKDSVFNRRLLYRRHKEEQDIKEV